MPTLAQDALETAYLLRTKPRVVFERVHEALYQTGRLQRGTFTNHFNELSNPDNAAELADMVQNAMRFTLSQDLANAMVKMSHNAPLSKLYDAYPYAKLPFPRTWIEFTQEDKSARQAWHIEETPRGLLVRMVASHAYYGHVPFYNSKRFSFLMGPEKMEVYSPNSSVSTGEQEEAFIMASYVLSMLLLMNSRSRIIRHEVSNENVEKLNKARRAQGRPELLPITTLKFDVSRLVSKGMSAKEASATMAAALVRGHLKLRKTGVFFWSPYVRGAKSEAEKQDVIEVSLQRNRDLHKSGLAELPGGLMPS